METTTWIWISGALSALLSGLGKTGIPGVGILPIALFALLFPARASVGIMLPLLICGDIVGVSIYRRKAHGRQLLRLFPWTAAGVLPGWLLMKRIDDNALGWLIGAILLFLIGLHLLRRLRTRKVSNGASEERGTTHGSLYTAFIGALAGFTSMVSNGAGPILVLYLLAMRLPKIEFVGTQAWFFFALNLFKVPFGAEAGLITGDSLVVSAQLVPAMVIGAVAGPWILRRINQKVFETAALVLTIAAAAWLIAKPWIVPTTQDGTSGDVPPPASARPGSAYDRGGRRASGLSGLPCDVDIPLHLIRVP